MGLPHERRGRSIEAEGLDPSSAETQEKGCQMKFLQERFDRFTKPITYTLSVIWAGMFVAGMLLLLGILLVGARLWWLYDMAMEPVNTMRERVAHWSMRHG